MTEPEQQRNGASPGSNGASSGIRTDIPHPARVYDYWLGGKDNFEADRSAAERAIEIMPEFLDYARGNRQWMARVARFLSEEAGIRQFLDIGAGLPTSPNVHEIVHQTDPGARVVYVDNDPVVFLHAEALMTDTATTSVVRADMRDTEEVLARAGELLDLTKPVALMFVASLHHAEDEDDPADIVARYLAALGPGSYLVLSHCTDEFEYEKIHQAASEAKERGAIFVPRGKDDIARMFNGRELLDPGLVLVSYWRPDGGQPDANADRVWAYGGVAKA
jgi:hypothetical protein